MPEQKMTVSQKAKQVAVLIKSENPDYFYLKELFRHLRKELNIKVQMQPKKLPYVPSDEDIQKYYDAVWQAQDLKHMVLIRTMLYTGVRIGELIKIKLEDVDIKQCQIFIQHGNNGAKSRTVPFPENFKKTLKTYMQEVKKKNKKALYLFESSWKKPFSKAGIRKILKDYTDLAKMDHEITPHKLRHFLFAWMKKHEIDDALLHAYSGHESIKSLEMYSKPSIIDAQKVYNQVISEFPV